MSDVGRRRGTSSERGYGPAHQRERARWAPAVAGGTVRCARCGRLIEPGTPWDLGHTDDRTGWTGPEHARCNREAGARKAAAVTNARRATIRRDWGAPS